DLIVADEPELPGVDEKRRHPHRLRRRGRRAQLAVHRHDCRLAVAEAELAVAMTNEMLPVLFLQELAWRRRAGGEPLVDRLLRRVVRPVVALTLREVEADVRKELNRRVEQHGAPDAAGVQGRELEHQSASEGVSDPVGVADAGVVEGLEQVVQVRRDRPRGLPVGSSVAAQVRGEHAETAREAFLTELPESATVRVEAVHAHDGRRAWIAPLVQCKQQTRKRPGGGGIGASQWMTPPTSAAVSIGAGPWFTAATTFAFTKPVSSSVSPGTPTATSRRGATGRPKRPIARLPGRSPRSQTVRVAPTAAPAVSASSRARGMSSDCSSDPRQTTTSASSRSRAGAAARRTTCRVGWGTRPRSKRSTVGAASLGGSGSNIRGRRVASCGVVAPMIPETMFPP